LDQQIKYTKEKGKINPRSHTVPLAGKQGAKRGVFEACRPGARRCGAWSGGILVKVWMKDQEMIELEMAKINYGLFFIII
jgi:hypothetical protein